MNPTRVLIVGAGRLGQALAGGMTGPPRTAISLWDSNPDVLPGSLSLPTLAHTADVVFLTIPTSSVRSALSDVGLHLPSATMIALVSKGLEPNTGWTAAEIAADSLPRRRGWAVLGGPLLAEELRAGVGGRVIVAGPGQAMVHILETLFSPERLSVTASTAPAHEVSLAGVLKNVYAMIYGLGVGLNWKTDELATLWHRCEVELLQAGDVCGVASGVMTGLAGLEDFRTTAGSAYSRHRRAGAQLATSHVVDHQAEGIQALPLLLQRWPKLDRLECFHGLKLTLEAKRPPTDLRSRILLSAKR